MKLKTAPLTHKRVLMWLLLADVQFDSLLLGVLLVSEGSGEDQTFSFIALFQPGWP